MKPDAKQAGIFKVAQRRSMFTSKTMSCPVSSFPQLMEKVDRFSANSTTRVKSTQQVELAFLWVVVKSSTGSNKLRQQFSKLPELDQTGVRIIAEILLGLAAQPDKL